MSMGCTASTDGTAGARVVMHDASEAGSAMSADASGPTSFVEDAEPTTPRAAAQQQHNDAAELSSTASAPSPPQDCRSADLARASSEALSSAACTRMRREFIAGAAPGSVYQQYHLGQTLGAALRARLTRRAASRRAASRADTARCAKRGIARRHGRLRRRCARRAQGEQAGGGH
jgi:hypothetical protein